METTCEGTNQSQWRLVVKDVASGKAETMVFDAVMLCCGHHAEKIIPSFPGRTNLFCDVNPGVAVEYIKYHRSVLSNLNNASVFNNIY